MQTDYTKENRKEFIIMKTVEFECPICGAPLEIPVDYTGDTFHCPVCDEDIEITAEWRAELDAAK